MSCKWMSMTKLFDFITQNFLSINFTFNSKNTVLKFQLRYSCKLHCSYGEFSKKHHILKVFGNFHMKGIKTNNKNNFKKNFN